ncbi:MAG TPA: (deoxy)nucleoside triphosphate pyrophosphohydrolase [Desulfobacteria bacterium]|nr:(deoxy)nucleoside triphosphate pyrophosphohydrolase [Desulfobacteria bacterium]
MKLSKHIQVSCAIIEQDGCFLAVQRSAQMDHPLKWEFPGGKIEPGESPEDCLKREIREELGMNVSIEKPLPPLTHAYATFSITLYPFRCHVQSGNLLLHEHRAFKWLTSSRSEPIEWTEADQPVLETYLKGKNG